MATIKALIDEFCDLILQPREASYVGSTTPAARQYLALFRFVAKQLLDQPNGWTQLKRTYVFTTATGVALYQLPGDFGRLLSGTQWGVTNQIPLSGPLSNAALAFQTYGTTAQSPYAGFQINGPQGYIFNTVPYAQRSAGYFQISPGGPDNVTQNVIAYTSSNYVWPRDWVTLTSYTLGQIVTGIANMYICTTAGTSGATRPRVTTGTVVDGTVTWTVYSEPYPITADTDLFLLDDTLMTEGLRWAWNQAKKFDYLSLEAQWRNSVRSALGRQNGSAIVNAGYNNEYGFPWPVTSDGGWTI